MTANTPFQSCDLQKLHIPEDIILKKDCIDIKEGFRCIENAQIYYREVFPMEDTQTSPISVLLLHGKMFSSLTWKELGTIQILAAMGYHTVAIDLPGYVNTPPIEVPDKVIFLEAVIHSFGLSHPVIVSPSMSGIYSIPYLLKNFKSMAGYIPVAPIGYQLLEEFPPAKDFTRKNEVYAPLKEFLHDPVPDLSDIKVPTMVVFGEKDRSRSSALLSLLPQSQCQEIPNGRHPAYLDNPSLWHQLLYNFLGRLTEEHIIG